MSRNDPPFLIVRENQAAGYVRLTADRVSEGLLLRKLYRRRSCRGLSLEKAAPAFAEDLCRQRHILTLSLTVNRHNRHCLRSHERIGFSDTGPIAQGIGNELVMDALEMVKQVARAT